jgi:3-phosphoshikimate 1-carboxyvinyltransferase
VRDARSLQPLCFPSDATLTLPGSKSEANRLLVAAALSGQQVTITGASPSDDVRHLVAGLATLGFEATWLNEANGIVRVGPRMATPPTTGELFCGNAGTALRFLVSVAAITPGDWTITGDAHMQQRPIQPLVDAWQKLGVQIEANAGCPPVRVRGGTCNGNSVTIDPTLSSQFVSSLLLVGAALPNGLSLQFAGKLGSRSYAELTCSLLARVGVHAMLTADAASVRSLRCTCPSPLAVGGDWSGMGVWTCLNHLTGSRVRGSNLVAGSGQADEQLGAVLQSLSGDGERTIDVAAIPDQFLNLAIVAAFRRGTTRLTGAANVRIKECDRIAVMARELHKLGVALDEHPDGLSVRGSAVFTSASIDPESDHRIAMAFALAGLLAPGITIEDPHCVAKSYPTFWDDLAAVRAQHRPVAIVGMRASGKTTLGQQLARHCQSTFVDSDALFVAAHGDIAAYVSKHGWPGFRQEEQRIVLANLKPGHILATGGGAIESPTTRAALVERCEVIWLQAGAALLQARLRLDQTRPSLTGASVADEVQAVLAQREPWYRSVANRIVDAGLPLPEQLAIATAHPR